MGMRDEYGDNPEACSRSSSLEICDSSMFDKDEDNDIGDTGGDCRGGACKRGSLLGKFLIIKWTPSDNTFLDEDPRTNNNGEETGEAPEQYSTKAPQNKAKEGKPTSTPRSDQKRGSILVASSSFAKAMSRPKHQPANDESQLGSEHRPRSKKRGSILGMTKSAKFRSHANDTLPSNDSRLGVVEGETDSSHPTTRKERARKRGSLIEMVSSFRFAAIGKEADDGDIDAAEDGKKQFQTRKSGRVRRQEEQCNATRSSKNFDKAAARRFTKRGSLISHRTASASSVGSQRSTYAQERKSPVGSDGCLESSTPEENYSKKICNILYSSE